MGPHWRACPPRAVHGFGKGEGNEPSFAFNVRLQHFRVKFCDVIQTQPLVNLTPQELVVEAQEERR